MTIEPLSLADLLPAYLIKNYANKVVAIDYTSDDGDIEICTFDTPEKLEEYALRTQANIWQNGVLMVDLKDGWQHQCDVIAFVKNLKKKS